MQDQSERDSSLEKMRVSADISNMVENITYVVDGGFNASTKLLYLTNRQATLINNNEIMNSLLDQLNIRNPNFLFIFETALIVDHIKLCINPTWHEREDKFLKYDIFESEFCEKDFILTRTQLIDFMSKVIIPIAKDTNAVILLCEGTICFFNEALEKALGFSVLFDTIQRPFTIVQIVNLYSIYHKSNDTNSNAFKILSKSKIFEKRGDFLTKSGVAKFWEDSFIPAPAGLSINSSRIIVVEAIDEMLESKYNLDNSEELKISEDEAKSFYAPQYGPQYALYKLMVGCLSKGVPSLAIGSFDTYNDFITFVEHLDTNIPVLLLDSRERLFSFNKLITTEKDTTPMITATQYATKVNAFPSIR